VSVWQILRVAVRALARNKGRSFLTILGIVIGVAAVIAMLAIGEGAQVQIKEAFAKMGTNLLIVRSGSSHFFGMHGGFGSQPTVTMDDFHAIQQLPTVLHATVRPEVTMMVQSEQANWTVDVGGVTPEFFQIREWQMASGRTITQSDVDAGTKVTLLGQTVVEQLFGASDPVGQQVRIGNVPFTVVGVLAKKGQTPGGGDLDNNVYIPSTTYRAKVQGGMKNFADGAIFIRATSQEEAARCERQIAELLRDRHHIAPGSDDDFVIRNMVELASAQDEGVRTMKTLLASVAFVSLLVAGIGIMNIMLVSVTERTREIGVRMAVGAKPKNILAQFLVEAVMLSGFGGLLGVGLGILTSERISAWFGWPLLLRPDGIVLAVGVSATVGILFGFYPAWRAAGLDPIEALRFE
jgi:putative ABC transport system permease protein